MKVTPSVKHRCPKCKIVKRKGKIYVICESTFSIIRGNVGRNGIPTYSRPDFLRRYLREP